MDWKLYIEQKPGVMLGKPVIKGTRLTVELILEDLGEGATESDLLTAYPNLQSEHIKAALAYITNSPYALSSCSFHILEFQPSRLIGFHNQFILQLKMIKVSFQT